MSGTLEAKVIRVEIQTGGTGRIYASSPDIKGLWIGRRSLEELEAALPNAISEMYAACGVPVVVSRLRREGEADDREEYVAFPAELAKAALQAQAR